MATLINPKSLSKTVDAVNEAFFLGEPIAPGARRETARWIASRQGLPGAYGALFAGFDSERRDGIRVFTGERIASASARHILGEESCRALHLLASDDPLARAALTRANDWLVARIEQAAKDAPRNSAGAYCCGKCTVGLWRNILAGGLDRQEQRIGIGLKRLRAARDGEGEWRAFPFWYTVLALAEMDHKDAEKELQYAAARITAEAGRAPGATPYARRRNAVAKHAAQQL